MGHHAYLLVGEAAAVDDYLDRFFAERGIRLAGNPDAFVLAYDVFGVDDARALGQRSAEKAFGRQKVFVVKAGKFTTEAQNALLKTLEDPSADTQFFISAREESMFLPTVLSRLEMVRVGGGLEEGGEAEKFLAKPIKSRLDFAKKFADEIKEGPPEGRGAGALAEFLDSLVIALRERSAPVSAQKTVLALRRYAGDSGAMPRLILEHLALSL